MSDRRRAEAARLAEEIVDQFDAIATDLFKRREAHGGGTMIPAAELRAIAAELTKALAIRDAANVARGIYADWSRWQAAWSGVPPRPRKEAASAEG